MSKLSATSSRSTATVSDRITIYVPLSCLGVLWASTHFVKARFLAGGWTTRRVAGGWIDPEGKIHAEPVDEHEFLVPYDKAKAVKDHLTAFADELLASGEQAVLLTVQYNVFTSTYTLKG